MRLVRLVVFFPACLAIQICLVGVGILSCFSEGILKWDCAVGMRLVGLGVC